MYSPLSGVDACLFLESGPLSIYDKDFRYFHYIDILFIYPWNKDLTKIKDKLNKIKPTIDFYLWTRKWKLFFFK